MNLMRSDAPGISFTYIYSPRQADKLLSLSQTDINFKISQYNSNLPEGYSKCASD